MEIIHATDRAGIETRFVINCGDMTQVVLLALSHAGYRTNLVVVTKEPERSQAEKDRAVAILGTLFSN